MQAIVSHKWNQFALKLLYGQLFMFAVWLLSFTIFTKLFQVCLGTPQKPHASLAMALRVNLLALHDKHLCVRPVVVSTGL